MAETTLEVDKQPGTPSVGQPASGTYGEGQALTNLQSSLPPMQQPGPTAPALPTVSTEPPVAPAPSREGRPPTNAALPPGISSAIMAPSNRPDVPVSTPLATDGAPAPAPATDAQRYLQVLDVLAESPQVSHVTREWAQLVRRQILGG